MQNAPIRDGVVSSSILGLELERKGVQNAKRHPGRGAVARGKLLRSFTAQKGSQNDVSRRQTPSIAKSSQPSRESLCL